MGVDDVKVASSVVGENGDRARSSYGVDPSSLNSQVLRRAVDRGYRVDDDGVLWSFTRRRLNPRACGGSNGYPRFTVRMDDGSLRTLAVHRLVAWQKYGEAIFEPRIEVRHLNGNRMDFRPSNIVIGTHHENMMDVPEEVRIAHASRAAESVRSLRPEDVLEIRRMRAAGQPYKNLITRFGVCKATVSYVCTGRTYRQFLPDPVSTEETEQA